MDLDDMLNLSADSVLIKLLFTAGVIGSLFLGKRIYEWYCIKRLKRRLKNKEDG